MIANKIYLQPAGMVVNTVLDIVELQKGKTTFTDTQNGRVHFSVRMYAFRWEFRFTVTDIGKNRCRVQIEINGNTLWNKRLILQEFALLDSMLIAGAQIEITQEEEEEVEALGVQFIVSQEKADETHKKKDPARSRRLVAGAAVCAAVLAIGAASVYFATRPPGMDIPDKKVPLAAQLMIDENAMQIPAAASLMISERTVRYAQEPANIIKLPCYNNVAIPSGTKHVKISLPNPDGNQFLFLFEIVLSDSGEVLYTSGLVQPGMYVEDVTLSRELEKGEYGAALKISVFAPESFLAVGCSETEFVLSVQ